MKKLLLIILIVISLVMFTGCRKKGIVEDVDKTEVKDEDKESTESTEGTENTEGAPLSPFPGGKLP